MPLEKPLNLDFERQSPQSDSSPKTGERPTMNDDAQSMADANEGTASQQKLLDDLERYEKKTREQQKQIEDLRAESKKFQKRAAERQEQVNELAERNRELNHSYNVLNERQALLENELAKAEAQMAAITELLNNT